MEKELDKIEENNKETLKYLADIIKNYIDLISAIPTLYDEVNEKILEEYFNYKKQRNLPENEIVRLPYPRIETVVNKLKAEAIKEGKVVLGELEILNLAVQNLITIKGE